MQVFIDKIAEQALKKCDELGINNPSRREAFVGGYRYGLREGKNPWRKVSEELPPVNIEVVCKMKGVPHTEHFICKWDGKYWWHWNDCGREIKGWFGLNEDWGIIEWKEI